MDKAEQPIDLRRYFRIALANGWIVVLAMAVMGVGAYAWSSSSTPVFESRALVRVYNPTDSGASSGGVQRVDPAREVDIQVLYARSPDVTFEFRKSLGALAPKVEGNTVSAIPNADAIAIAVQSKNRTVAQAAARVYTNVYLKQRRAAIAASFASQADALRKQASALQTQITDLDGRIAAVSGERVTSVGGRPVVLPESDVSRNLNTQRTSLVTRQAQLVGDADQLEINGRNRQAEIDVVKPAELPKQPQSPKPKRDAAVGGLVGLLVGLGIAVLRQRLGDHITSTGELSMMLGPDVLIASIPSRGSSGGHEMAELADMGGPRRVAEAFRILRAEVMFATAERTPVSLLVTSPRASEGKTTLASNLAVSLAGTGARVIVVDADLRHGRIHEVFGVQNHTGLSALRKKSFLLSKAIQRAKIAGSTVDVLPRGAQPSDPSELLLSPSASKLMRVLKDHYDYIIIDGPPVLPVADALHVARLVDDVLLVAYAHRTQVGAFKLTVERLAQSSAKVLGAVLTAADPERGYDKYYDYLPSEPRSERRGVKKSPDWEALPPYPPQVFAEPKPQAPANINPAQVLMVDPTDTAMLTNVAPLPASPAASTQPNPIEQRPPQ